MLNAPSKFILALFWATVALMLATAGSAGAVTKYATNWSTLNSYATNAAQGDTIELAAGTYAGTLAPSTNGREPRPIVFTAPSGATVTDVNPKSHTRYYGITFTNAVDLGVDTKHVMFDRCNFGGLEYKDGDSSSVRNATVGGIDFTVCRDEPARGATADCDTLESCTFTSLSAATWYPILFGTFSTTDPNCYVANFVQRFNTFNISQSGSAAYTPAKHFHTYNMLSYANKFIITSTATGIGANEGSFGYVFRDSSYNLTMRRDTLLFNNEGASFSTTGLMSASGGAGNEVSCTGWTIDSCYIRVYNGSPVYFQAQTQGLKFRYNVLRSRLSAALSLGFAYSASSNDPYIHHNTLMGAQAVHFGDQANTGGRFSNNILWGTSTASCAEGTAVGGTGTSITSISDSNYVYATNGDSTRAFYRGGCAAARASGGWTTNSNDTHSYFGNPSFADTSWASLNPTPPAGNFSIAGGRWTLGYAGARNISDAPLAITAVVADVKDKTAGLSFYLANDIDSTATVLAFYGAGGSATDTTATWYRRPSDGVWATSLFGLLPSVTYSIHIVATRGGTTATFDTTIVARDAAWWRQDVTGPSIYVSPSGNDATGTGTYAAPYRTIATAWAALLAKPNKGRGGAVALKTGTYYQSNVLDGADGFGRSDTLYHITTAGDGPVTISGADERYTRTDSLTWTATGVNGIYRAAPESADSLSHVVIGSHVLHKRTSMTELIQHTANTGYGTWDYNDYAYYVDTTGNAGRDTLYVRYAGVSPSASSTFMALGYRGNLLWVRDKYVRVTGLTFAYAGGQPSRNGCGVRLGTGGASSYSANGSVVDSCTFNYNEREAIYSITGTTRAGDSIVVANNAFYHNITPIGYTAMKGRVEENMCMLATDGDAWYITTNTGTGYANGIQFGASDSTHSAANNMDVDHNTVSLLCDDGIEADGSAGLNNKVYLNFIDRCNNGISLAPIYGGPHFVLYNRIRGYNYWGSVSGAFKFGTGDQGASTGIALIANNTCFSDSLSAACTVYEAGGLWNKHFVNNIMTGKTTALPIRQGYHTAAQGNDFNYNLLWTWGGSTNVALWGATTYTTTTIKSGLGWEKNGVFANPQFADTSSTLVTYGGIDAGKRLAGISGVVVSLRGGLPDIGANESSVPPTASSRRRGWLYIWLHVLGRN